MDDEISSTKHVVRKLINPNGGASECLIDNVAELIATSNYSIDQSVREVYSTSSLAEKEHLGRALLVGTAFIRLCMLNCARSLARVLTPLPSFPKVPKKGCFRVEESLVLLIYLKWECLVKL